MKELTALRDEPEEPGCPICDASLYWEDCEECGGDGYHDDLHELEPFWYHPGDTEDCQTCKGYGGWYRCSEKHTGKRYWLPSELPG